MSIVEQVGSDAGVCVAVIVADSAVPAVTEPAGRIEGAGGDSGLAVQGRRLKIHAVLHVLIVEVEAQRGRRLIENRQRFDAAEIDREERLRRASINED